MAASPGSPSLVEMLAAALFALALLHTFSARYFETRAHRHPRHAGLWHLLGEVEAVFGIWAMVLVLGIFAIEGREAATRYLDSQNFTEPMFVFAIMVVAASRPILALAQRLVTLAARAAPFAGGVAFYFFVLSLVPLMGSFITEPAAMTLAALMLRDRYIGAGLSKRMQYATLGVLFVNISIGGTLTPFAAPPVLMVAGTWNWDLAFMMSTFGWKAALAVIVNALAATVVFRRELARVDTASQDERAPVPWAVTLAHLVFLLGVVVFAHHPPVFMGLLLFFIGLAHAYERHQDRLILREALMVAFFLAGLVVLGSLQRWWLQPLLSGMDDTALFFGAMGLTAFTDNAALTYLGSLVQGVTPGFQYALVAGAVAGGGLTVIANAPNPAGYSILRTRFPGETVHPLGLLAAALPPTAVAAAAFLLF